MSGKSLCPLLLLCPTGDHTHGTSDTAVCGWAPSTSRVSGTSSALTASSRRPSQTRQVTGPGPRGCPPAQTPPQASDRPLTAVTRDSDDLSPVLRVSNLLEQLTGLRESSLTGSWPLTKETDQDQQGGRMQRVGPGCGRDPGCGRGFGRGRGLGLELTGGTLPAPLLFQVRVASQPAQLGGAPAARAPQPPWRPATGQVRDSRRARLLHRSSKICAPASIPLPQGC